MPTNILTVLPEISLAVGTLLLLLWGAFNKNETFLHPLQGALTLMILVLGILLWAPATKPVFAFSHHFVHDTYSQYLKIILLIGAFLVLWSTRTRLKTDQIISSEYPVLLLLSLLGMMIMVSANSLLSLFMGLELQSLSLYVMTAIKRDDSLSAEAGMKYFILGALSTGMLLYGISFIYGTTGSLIFCEISQVLGNKEFVFPAPFLIGLFFLLAGLAFKISTVPFHMWTPDVYQGAPFPVTLYLATIPKIAAFGLLARLLIQPFGTALSQWEGPILLLSGLSMIIGFVGMLNQQNIKRLIAYSAIANSGFGLMGLIANSSLGLQSLLIYFILYSLTILAFLLGLLVLHERRGKSEGIEDLAGLVRTEPVLAFIFVFLLFSLAGVPPLAGFFGKLYIFKAALAGHYVGIALIGLVASVLGAAYYLWIIKIITMNPPAEPAQYIAWDRSESTPQMLLLCFILVLLTFFFLYPAPFIGWALEGATALFPIP